MSADHGEIRHSVKERDKVLECKALAEDSQHGTDRIAFELASDCEHFVAVRVSLPAHQTELATVNPIELVVECLLAERGKRLVCTSK